LPRKKSPRFTSFHIDNADADQLSEHYAKMGARMVIEPLATHKYVTVEDYHQYNTGSFRTWTGAYPSGMQIKFPEPPDAYAIYLPIAGRLDIDIGSQRFKCGPDSAFIGDMSTFERLCLHEGTRATGIAFGKDVVIRQLSELLDAPVNKKLEFSAVMDGTAAAITRISTVSALLWTNLANEPENVASAKFAELQFQSLVVLLLEGVPHNYSAALACRVSPAMPRHVKRAIDFMVANVAMPITIAEVARASGSSVRSLNLGFQRFKGTSTLQYLRQIRLEGVRRTLTSDVDHGAISQIAQQWGFTHMGRFAALYKEAFGQSPSETVRYSGTRWRP